MICLCWSAMIDFYFSNQEVLPGSARVPLQVQVYFLNCFINNIRYIQLCTYVYIYSTPPPWTRCDLKSNLSEVKLVWIHVLVALLVEGPSLPYYLSIAERRTDWFIPFSRALVWNEMQTAFSGFELGSLILFPMTLTIMLSTSPITYICRVALFLQ